MIFFLLILGNYMLFSNGLKGLDTFLYLLVYPILFYGFRQLPFSIDLTKSIRFFILSIVVASTLLLIINMVNGTLSMTTNTYFSETLGVTHVYFGLFLGLGSCFVMGFNFNKNPLVNPIFDHVLLLIFMVILIYIGARMSLIGVFIVLGLYCYKLLSFEPYIKIISVIGVCILFFSVSYFFIPRVKQDLNYINKVYVSVKTNDKEDLVENSWRNMYRRFLVLSYTGSEIKHHLFTGIGMANVTSQISEQIIKDGYIYFKPLNTHNQYLHYLVGMGVVGLLFFCWLLYYFFTHQIQGTLGVFFMLFFMTTMLTESVLVRVKGIALFFLFYLLFCSKKVIIND
ncbi:O-antigen ligase family protein [Flavobacteriaceae bacterium F08102]|nr:O-antigen ligase family protein [Flavobacteriaceae bacterium F08102]